MITPAKIPARLKGIRFDRFSPVAFCTFLRLRLLFAQGGMPPSHRSALASPLGKLSRPKTVTDRVLRPQAQVAIVGRSKIDAASIGGRSPLFLRKAQERNPSVSYADGSLYTREP